MSKRILSFLISIAVIQSTGAVFPAAATSTDIILTHIQVGVTGGATQEFIGIYNKGSEPVDITDWCLKNKSGSTFACFGDAAGEEGYRLPSYRYATVVSRSFYTAQPAGFVATLTYDPVSQSSGSLVGSNDRLSLVDEEDIEKDSYEWTASIASGSIFERTTLGEIVGGWGVEVRNTLPSDQAERYEIVNETPPPVIPSVHITEVLANAKGSDEGYEFIEFYNAGTEPIDLSGYHLWLGLSPTAPVIIPDGIVVEPLTYRALYNHEVDFTLVNTTGTVRLAFPTGETIDETDSYVNPKDDEAWVFIDGVWQYSNMPTPGMDNLLNTTVVVVPLVEITIPKPCAANQYRSPDTGRCRLITTATTTSQTPCQPDQYRSPETGRCRKIAVASTPAPCKEGQERNEETNRCRNVKAMTTSDYSVLAATTEQRPNQWYIVWVIAAVVALLLGYALWEWRGEVSRLVRAALKFVRKGK